MWVPVNSKVTAAKVHKWLHWALAPQACFQDGLAKVQGYSPIRNVDPPYPCTKLLDNKLEKGTYQQQQKTFSSPIRLFANLTMLTPKNPQESHRHTASGYTLPSSQEVLIGEVHMIIHPIGLSNLCGHPIFGGPGTIPSRVPRCSHVCFHVSNTKPVAF